MKLSEKLKKHWADDEIVQWLELIPHIEQLEQERHEYYQACMNARFDIEQLAEERDKYKAELQHDFEGLRFLHDSIADERNRFEKDRDIWKKACELVCDAPGADPYFLKEQHYWYDEAKKVLEQE